MRTQKSYVEGFLIHSKSTRDSDLVYLYKDHLGSVEAMADKDGNYIDRKSFAPWGYRQKSSWQTGMPDIAGLRAITSKGFTGHEHLDDVGLIHMNGRVYDPDIGRFLSPDLFIQAPTNTQSYNRYSYVMNNPLSLVDPDGYISCQAGMDIRSNEECSQDAEKAEIEAEKEDAKKEQDKAKVEGVKSDNESPIKSNNKSGSNKKASNDTAKDPIVDLVKSEMKKLTRRMKRKESFGFIFSTKSGEIKGVFINGRGTFSISEKEIKQVMSMAMDLGATKFLGEWHNHPSRGGDINPSQDDIDSSNYINLQTKGHYRAFLLTPNNKVYEWDTSLTDRKEVIKTKIDHGKLK